MMPVFHSVQQRNRSVSPFNGSVASSGSNTSRDRRILPPPPKGNIMYQETRYKTELCRQYHELGICEYGDRCLFAHGYYELKPLAHRHPKFKTEKCSAFNQVGFCGFGPRCSFIHEQPDPFELLENLARSVQKIPMPENNSYEFPPLPAGATVDQVVLGMLFDKDNIFKSSHDDRLPIFTQICQNEDHIRRYS